MMIAAAAIIMVVALVVVAYAFLLKTHRAETARAPSTSGGDLTTISQPSSTDLLANVCKKKGQSFYGISLDGAGSSVVGNVNCLMPGRETPDSTINTHLEPQLVGLDKGVFQLMPLSQPFVTGDQLIDFTVDTPDDGWAVGSKLTPGATKWWQRTPLALHWNGKTWDRVSVAAVPKASESEATGIRRIEAVAATSATDAWAFGWRDIVTDEQMTLAIEHWDGHTWTLQDLPPDLPGAADVTAAAANGPNDVWAVGNAFSNQAPYNTIQFSLHWDGNKWTVTQGSSQGALNDVQVATNGTAYAIGSSKSGTDALVNSSSVYRWNGHSWSSIGAPSEFHSIDDVRVLPSGNVIIASIAEGRNALVAEWNGREWHKVAQDPNTPPIGPMVEVDGQLWLLAGNSAGGYVWVLLN